MITIGVDNTLDIGKDTIEYIYERSKNNKIKIRHIAPLKSTVYKNSQIVSIKNYVESLQKEQEIDLLLIEFKKTSIEQDFYRHLRFDIIVLFDRLLSQRPYSNHKIYFEHKILNDFKSKCYLIPDRCLNKKNGCITYGWHKDADISVSSAEQDPKGLTKIQCCVQTCLPTQKGHFISPKEFPVYGKSRYTEELIAGAAICLLYGFDTDRLVSENNIYNMV